MTREEILQQISASLPDAVRYYQDPSHEVGLTLLRELAQNDLGIPGVALFLASMPHTPSRVLEQLAQLDDLEVALKLANNPALHPKLAVHPNPAVRRLIAAHRRLVPGIAQQLAKDSDAFVREELAKNSLIPTNIQRTLLADPVPFVRLALLENRHLDSEFMDGLSDDLNPTVHACALLTPRLSPLCMKSWSEFDEELGQLALSRRTDLHPGVVTRLAESAYPRVRQSLLQHQPNFPEELLAEFLASPEPAVLLRLVSRPQLSARSQHALLENPAFPPEGRLALAKRGDLADEAGVALVEGNSSSEVLQALAQNLAEGLSRTRCALAACHDPFLLKLLLANPYAIQEPQTLSTLVMNASDDVLCHLPYRGIPCAELTPEARERLAHCALPSVRALVVATTL
ncbi:MAG: hypothetical protein J6Y80_01285 [Victivallales bacterium]|nr:hypothetical protein [Victivallales bacterium]